MNCKGLLSAISGLLFGKQRQVAETSKTLFHHKVRRRLNLFDPNLGQMCFADFPFSGVVEHKKKRCKNLRIDPSLSTLANFGHIRPRA